MFCATIWALRVSRLGSRRPVVGKVGGNTPVLAAQLLALGSRHVDLHYDADDVIGFVLQTPGQGVSANRLAVLPVIKDHSALRPA